MDYGEKLKEVIDFLNKKEKILFLTTSTRWNNEKELPKSSLLAKYIAEKVGNKKVKIIDVSKLKIYVCEGNVSSSKGNNCGVKKAILKDKKKNPSGCHRCWASINNKDDELWKISKELLDSEVVLFFGSVRWGQMNSIYQKLIERLTWIENRHSTLKEENMVENIYAGIVVVGQNWRGNDIVKIQRNVLNYYGFKTPKKLSFNWQYTNNSSDESQKSYKDSLRKFKKDFGIK